LIAGLASLCLIALFPQDRWLFILALSVYIGFCTYMMGSAKYQYFWFVCGYVCIIVALESGPNSVMAFTLAILRLQETGLGIIVYSIITALLWRSNSAEQFNVLVNQLDKTQHQFYRCYFNRLNGQDAEFKPILSQQIQQQTTFKTLMDAAETDSYEIWETRQQWQLYQQQQLKLTEIIEQLQNSFNSEQTLLISNLKSFDDELEQRFKQIELMQQGKPPEYQPQSLTLTLNHSAISLLSAFQKSALLTTTTKLQQLEQLTQALFNNIADIKGFQSQIIANKTPKKSAGFVIDIERLASIIQVMATLWLSFLAFIYIYDLPGGILLVVVTGVIGMALAANQNLPVSSMFMPFASSTLYCSILYAIIMPQLSNFWELGSLIFISTFLICYVYSSPQQGMGRAAGLAVFVTMINVNNQQAYNILSVFNTALVFIEMFIILVITANIPFSARPEKAVTRLLNRFFRSSHYVMTRPLSFWERQCHAYHYREINSLPNKIKLRSQRIKIQGISTQQIQTMMIHLQKLSRQLQGFIEVRNKPQALILSKAFANDAQHWQVKIQHSFQQLLTPSSLDNQTELKQIAQQLETRIKTILNDVTDNQLSETDKNNFYQLLGAYQSVSEALLDYSTHAQQIDWQQWQQPRF